MAEFKCPYCGETISEDYLEEVDDEVFACPFCGKLISTDDI